MSLSDRQAELADTHRAVQDADLPYVLVGGWAVSAFQTRITVDVDMVLPESSLEDYDALLGELGYQKESDTDVSNIYEGRMVQYVKPVGENTVEFDALVNALRCRQTDAEWSYDYLEEHSVVRELNVAPDLSARIPEPALLFAIKLHSGRIADTRDLVTISSEADLDRVERHLDRGDQDALESQIKGVLDRLESDGFEDSFKGVFEQQEMPSPRIEEVKAFLRERLDDKDTGRS